jgi:ketosteroid isomerase-like protein
VPPLLSKHQETPRYNIDHEVKQSITPNLNLSTYGYSVNATDTTRQKALFDAVSKEGIDAVRNRIIWLLEKYADKEELVQILSCDFDWLDKYYTSTSLRERFDSQRKQIKQKIYQRMQEKSKSRRRSLKDHYRN